MKYAEGIHLAAYKTSITWKLSVFESALKTPDSMMHNHTPVNKLLHKDLVSPEEQVNLRECTAVKAYLTKYNELKTSLTTGNKVQAYKDFATKAEALSALRKPIKDFVANRNILLFMPNPPGKKETRQGRQITEFNRRPLQEKLAAFSVIKLDSFFDYTLLIAGASNPNIRSKVPTTKRADWSKLVNTQLRAAISEEETMIDKYHSALASFALPFYVAQSENLEFSDDKLVDLN
jgi:hypothetical protein